MSTAAAVLGQAEDALIAGTAAAFAVESMMPSYGFSCRAVISLYTNQESVFRVSTCSASFRDDRDVTFTPWSSRTLNYVNLLPACKPPHGVDDRLMANNCVSSIITAQSHLQPQSLRRPKLCHPMAVAISITVACRNQPQQQSVREPG